jgi:hypothetical protein
MKIFRFNESEDTSRRRGELTTLFVTIGDKKFFNREASSTFIQVIEFIADLVGPEKFVADNTTSIGRIFIRKDDSSFPTYVGISSIHKSKTGLFYISTHCSTQEKKNIIDYLLKRYGISGSSEIRTRSSVDWSSSKNIEDSSSSIEIQKKHTSVVNPFGAESIKNGYSSNTSALCVLGKSGAGKTYRIERTLNTADHKMELIIPSSSTTNLLVQYTKGEYILSRLGRFILRANSDTSNFYTVVFDECHKYIDMINDELLQCISTTRNDGRRFISLDPVTDELFSDLPESNGRRMIPDNLGFIFISSKEEIIRNNSDFYNRVDIITLDESDRDMDFLIDFLKSKIENKDEDFTM